MAARVKLDWQCFDFAGKGIASWRSLKKVVDFDEHPGLFTDRAVYVIRVCRPFSFSYGNRHSPVAYIGKGQAQKRITAHLKSWIPELARKIPDLKIRIYYCEPRARYHGPVDKGVEADLIEKFEERYGSLPLRNRKHESDEYERTYAQSELHVLHPGKGTGYHWALSPLPSSHFYRE